MVSTPKSRSAAPDSDGCSSEINTLLGYVQRRNPHEPQFCQAVQAFLKSGLKRVAEAMMAYGVA